MSGYIPTITKLKSDAPDFMARYDELLHWKAGDMGRIEKTVADIIARVRSEGDDAVIDLTRQFDRIALTPESMIFSEEEINAACREVDGALMRSLEQAAQRIWDYHNWQMPAMGRETYRDWSGVMLGQRTQPLKSVGLYVPGGLASYPSSVLMNALPARVAGVDELIMVVPTPDGVVNPLILAAARISGVDKIFRIGGAQAVAALAYGTEKVPGVDKIVGPGNIYVATAKRQVFGQCGIDMIAGPSEILVIADGENDPRWIAADLLSQAEHDEAAQSILITDDEAFADRVVAAMGAHLEGEEGIAGLSRKTICDTALKDRGGIIIARDLEDACQLASRAAPEHLELAVADPEALLPMIDHAGAIFLGRHTPEAMGDYVAGPNHVLPTGGTARFSSPLSVHDFIKRTSLISYDADSLKLSGPSASRLAASEGLTAHKLSVDLRLADIGVEVPTGESASDDSAS